MKLFHKLTALAAVALTLSACSSDAPDGPQGPGQDAKNGIFSSISFRLPQTRADENPKGPAGIEDGQNGENNVGSILVVLATKDGVNEEDNIKKGEEAIAVEGDYKFLTYALNDAPISNSSTSTHTIVFQDKDKLFGMAGKTVFIFAYCNPTQEIRDFVLGLEENATFTEEILQKSAETTWTPNGFLMTSVEVVANTLPDETTLRTYNSEDNAYPLGKVPVQRTAVRFDFKDAAPDGILSYTIYDIDDKDKAVGKVRLNRVAMFNLANKFYYFPRVTGNGKTILCPGFDGMEVSGDDVVVSPDLAAADYSDPLPARMNPLDDKSGLTWYNLADVLQLPEDYDDGWGDSTDEKYGENVPEGFDKTKYHIWRYATENTFAHEEAGYPDKTKVTGYVFEAEIQVAEDFGNVIDGKYSDMYLYRGRLYASAKAIADQVKKTPVSTLATAFAAGFTATTTEGVTTYTPKSDDELEALGFTVYHPDPKRENKYFCYYFAYNKHNDNADPTVAATMEYATVRNNVYKLSVKSIKRFGGFTPGEVDDWDTYFTLDIEVMPWVVRIYEMDF